MELTDEVPEPLVAPTSTCRRSLPTHPRLTGGRCAEMRQLRPLIHLQIRLFGPFPFVDRAVIVHQSEMRECSIMRYFAIVGRRSAAYSH